MNYSNKLKKAVEELEKQGSIALIAPVDIIVDYLVKAINSEVKQYKPQQSNRERENIKGTIKYLNDYLSSRGDKFLVAKIEERKDEKGDPLPIFIFKLEERWGELNVGGNYDFIVEMSDRGTYILVDFHKNY